MQDKSVVSKTTEPDAWEADRLNAEVAFCISENTESVITEKMWLAGLAEARRAGMGPAFTCCDYQKFKTWLSAAYRAMRLAECADER